MIIYKNFLKLSFKNKKSSFFFIVPFIIISFIYLFGGVGSSTVGSFNETALQLKIIDLDNSELSQNLIKYLKTKNSVKIISNESITDSTKTELSYVENNFIKEIKKDISLNLIDAGIILKKGLQKNLDTKNLFVLTFKDDRTNGSFYLNLQINKFLRFANSIKKNTGFYNFDKINSVLSKYIEVKKIEHKNNLNINILFLRFFNFFSWMLFSLILNLIGLVLFKLSEPSIQMRNNISSVSNIRFSVERLLAQITVIVLVSAVLIGIVVALKWSQLEAISLAFYCLNQFIFAIVILAMLFLLNTISHSGTVIGIMGNVLPLALAFISGVFVPIEILSPVILKIAKCFPLYYLVKANQFSFNCNSIDWKDLGILVVFFIFYFSIGIYFYKIKRQKKIISILDGGIKK